MKDPALTWPHRIATRDETAQDRHVWLRLLETTDVHAHLMPFDYHRGQDVPDYGLARTATLIETARAEAHNTLLFDNGDFLQGSVLSDLAAGPGSGWPGPHPVIAAMNTLDYAAVTLGNHEFNFGLDWLRQALSQAQFPVVCANALHVSSSASTGPSSLMPPSVLLRRNVRDNHGHTHQLSIGILGLLPPQITVWDRLHLDGAIATRDIVETAMTEVPRLRAEGADLVIVLAHSGLASPPPLKNESAHRSDRMQENAIVCLAGVPGIDALLAGHSHQVFPNALGKPDIPGVDHSQGTVAGVPTVLAGFRGSHLGVLDLCLSQVEDVWRITASHSAARPVQPSPQDPPTPSHPTIVATVAKAHHAAISLVSQPLCHLEQPLHSYLAQIAPCPTVELVLAAKETALRAALAGTDFADLPVLAATPPFKTGGIAGPGHYIDIPPGPLTLGHLAELYPFPNTLIGLRMTGAKLANWLERAASCFNQIAPGAGDRVQPLWNRAFPGHAFDTISGLDYVIDLSQPPRYAADGTCLDPQAQRIHNLRFNGAPIDPKAEFAVATNSFRAFGGGPYKSAPDDCVLYENDHSILDVLAMSLRMAEKIDTAKLPRRWHLTGPADAILGLKIGPGIHAYPDDLAAISARDTGLDKRGFSRLTIPLAALANPRKKP